MSSICVVKAPIRDTIVRFIATGRLMLLQRKYEGVMKVSLSLNQGLSCWQISRQIEKHLADGRRGEAIRPHYTIHNFCSNSKEYL